MVKALICALVIIASIATFVHGSDPNDPRRVASRLKRLATTRSQASASSTVVAAAAASSAPLGAGTINPEQVHIAYGGTPSASTFRVSWFTYNDTTTSVVKYGTTSGSYSFSDTGFSVTYFPDSYTHHVLLTQLGTQPASTTWYYIVGDTSTETWSEELIFISPRSTSDTTTPLKLAVFGDMGILNSNYTIAGLTARLDEYEAVLHIGDYSYADDRDLQPQLYESIWNTWANAIQPVASAKPYMTSPGNHEASCRQIGSLGCDSRHDNFTAYRYRFMMPSQESGGVESMWYSYDVGMVHFVSISSETDFPSAPEGPDTLWNGGPFGDQLSWLDADLAAANQPAARAQRPWIIVVGHRPIYTTSAHDFPFFATENLQKYMEPIFLKYNVDLYMSGHVHAYERTYPVCNNAVQQTNYVNPTCPVYLVNGAAGNIEGHSDFTSAQPTWSAYRNSQYFGFGEMVVYNSSVIEWSFIRADTNTVDDTVTLIKDSH